MQKKGHCQSSVPVALAWKNTVRQFRHRMPAEKKEKEKPDRILPTVTEDGISYESSPTIHEPFKATEHLGTVHACRV